MNQLWDISINAIKKDKRSIYELHLMALENHEASGQLYLVVCNLCSQYILNGKKIDTDLLNDINYDVYEKFKNQRLDLNDNIYGLLYRIFISQVSNYYKRENRYIYSLETGSIPTLETKDSVEYDLLFKDWVERIGDENLEHIQKSIEFFGDLHPLKAALYLNKINTLLGEGEMLDLIRKSSNPITFGYYNEIKCSSVYNLRHNLWSNFNIIERKFMRVAIDEMMKSISENRPGNPDPMVGACVVNASGKIIGTSYRGERRAEEHCEFILFDEKLKGIDVSDCTLYVTLEPCSKRGSTRTGVKKYPCADHIINSGIKKVCIGMLDPDENIFENGYQKLMEAGVDVWFFHSDLTQEIMKAEGNKKFIEHRSKPAM